MDEPTKTSHFGNRCFPLTPDSPMHPTLLPHVKETIEPIEPIEPIAGPITPPSPAGSQNTADSRSQVGGTKLGPSAAVLSGLHVLAAERDAVAHLHHVYATSTEAQESFATAVAQIAQTMRKRGKLVVSGVGKSGKIGQKFVATCNSLQIVAAWLHPTEALHGDLGVIGSNDTLVLLSHSSATTELHHLLPYVSHSPVIAVTGHPHAPSNPLFTLHPRTAPSIVLPAPVPVPEKELFGVAAPTTSTTVALAVCDALALSVAEELHADIEEGVRSVFQRCHPGGAIGRTHVEEQAEGRRKATVEAEAMEMG